MQSGNLRHLAHIIPAGLPSSPRISWPDQDLCSLSSPTLNERGYKRSLFIILFIYQRPSTSRKPVLEIVYAVADKGDEDEEDDDYDCDDKVAFHHFWGIWIMTAEDRAVGLGDP